MLRDRIVCEINDDMIKRRLLSESKLDYAKAVETALNMETAARSMKTLKTKAEGHTSSSPPQHRVNKASTIPPKQGAAGKSAPTCYRCRIRGHTVFKCRIDKNVVCHLCKRACKSKREAPESGTSKPKFQSVGRIEEEESDSRTSLISCQV